MSSGSRSLRGKSSRSTRLGFGITLEADGLRHRRGSLERECWTR